MTVKHFYILLWFLLIVSPNRARDTNDVSDYKLLSQTTTYVAGADISLKFSFTSNSDVKLYCSNSYGSVLLNPKINNKELIFKIPIALSKKSGVLNWQLITPKNIIRGQIDIKPREAIKTIESYLGPPSIEAGETDYTMLVTIPTDNLDNPLKDSTKVQVKHQFLDKQISDSVFTKHGFAYKNIYSYQPSGRILISSECLELNSKEFDVNVMPAIPTDFTISAKRIHDYADGNQMTTFTTSIIKDRYGNIVSDGTFVNFFITDKNGNKTQTFGATINGIATAKILHPDEEDQWVVKAYIEGMANSNSMALHYKQAVSDFDVSFLDSNRTIKIGPIKSFMNQKIPDGLKIRLKIYNKNNLEDELLVTTLDGFGNFKLNADRYPESTYSFIIESAGLVKSFKNITYE